MLANLVVEEEPGGDEPVGEDSQDESAPEATVPGETNATNSNLNVDEDTVASSLDGRESPTLQTDIGSASAFSAVDSDSSNSSVDMPLLPRREPAGTKRKAEVLKESGKIGVTITTSPSSGSVSPTPNKIPRLLPLKATSPTYHVSSFFSL